MAQTIKAQLLQQQLKAQGFFKRETNKRMPRIGTLAFIAACSTAKINEAYSGPEKKRDVELWWPEPLCGGTASTDAANCDITAEVPTSNKKVYTLNNVIQSRNFKLPRRDFETSLENQPDDLSLNIVNSEIALMETLSAQGAAFLDTPANKTDISLAGFGTLSAAVDATTKNIKIDAVKWNTKDVFKILWETANRLGFNDPVLLAGGALSSLMYDFIKDQNNENGKGNMARMADFDIFHDWKMDAITAKETIFMVERGQLGILNRPDWRNTAPEAVGKDRSVWSRDAIVSDTKQSLFAIGTGVSGNAVNLKIDIDHQLVCTSRTEISDAYRLILNADIVRAPETDCSKTALGGKALTGIVGFMNAADAA